MKRLMTEHSQRVRKLPPWVMVFTLILLATTVFCQQLVVCLDPGHGTKNSRGGTKDEAQITLAVALEIRHQLKNCWNTQAVLTHQKINQDLRAKNPDDDNRIRAGIANQSGAFLFIRLHCDAPVGKVAIYYPRVHPNQKIACLSKLAAEHVWTQIKTVLPANIPKAGVVCESKTAIGARHGGLLVGSRYSKIPTITIEMVPMSQSGKNWISQKRNQIILSKAISQGISDYRNLQLPLKNPPF